MITELIKSCISDPDIEVIHPLGEMEGPIERYFLYCRNAEGEEFNFCKIYHYKEDLPLKLTLTFTFVYGDDLADLEVDLCEENVHIKISAYVELAMKRLKRCTQIASSAKILQRRGFKMRTCPKCQKAYQPEENAFAYDGYHKATGERRLRSRCRTCVREECRLWRQAHIEHCANYNKTRKEREAAKSLPSNDQSIPSHVTVPAPASVEPIQTGSPFGTDAGPVN